MIQLTDTHCHLADMAFQNHLPDIMAQAQCSGVMRFIVPATCRDDWQAVENLSQHFSVNMIQTALGIHPWFVDKADNADLAELTTRLYQNPDLWVGEIGLDFYDKTQTLAQRNQQIQIFSQQLELAQSLHRRVIIHNVKATAAIAAVLRETKFSEGGIVHAFSGSIEEAKMLIGCGLKIGIGSLLLNPNAKKVRQVAKWLNLEDVVLETDSPFMLKDEINTPANVRKIAEILADFRGISIEEVAKQTEKNVEVLLKNHL